MAHDDPRSEWVGGWVRRSDDLAPDASQLAQLWKEMEGCASGCASGCGAGLRGRGAAQGRDAGEGCGTTPSKRQDANDIHIWMEIETIQSDECDCSIQYAVGALAAACNCLHESLGHDHECFNPGVTLKAGTSLVSRMHAYYMPPHEPCDSIIRSCVFHCWSYSLLPSAYCNACKADAHNLIMFHQFTTTVRDGAIEIELPDAVGLDF